MFFEDEPSNQWRERMRTVDAQLTRGIRRQILALNLIRRGMRTGPICTWTTMTRARVYGLLKAQNHEFPDMKPERPCGPAPEKLADFLRSPEMRREAAAIGGLCRMYGLLPDKPLSPEQLRNFPTLERGEKLVTIYDAYRKRYPGSRLTFDQMISVVMTLAEGEHELVHCDCGTAILVQRMEVRRVCVRCRERRRAGG
jgi:hypothetical protein